MSFYLGVWNSPMAISDEEAARQYFLFSDGKSDRAEFDAQVYAFYSRLTNLYPEIDMLPDDDALDVCPWACNIDVSGRHVIVAIRPDKSATVIPQVLTLAQQHELICFDPQAGKVYLPPKLSSASLGPAAGLL